MAPQRFTLRGHRLDGSSSDKLLTLFEKLSVAYGTCGYESGQESLTITPVRTVTSFKPSVTRLQSREFSPETRLSVALSWLGWSSARQLGFASRWPRRSL